MVKGKATEPVVKEPEAVDEYQGFEFMSQLKYERAIAAVGNEDMGAVLAEYDRLGGYIRYEGSKVINGAFWDSRKGMRVENPLPKILKKQAAIVEETIEVTPIKKAKKEVAE